MTPLQNSKLRPALMAGLCLWMVIHPLRATPSIAREWNEEILSRRLKGYRRIFSRFEKLDVMFLGFISFVLIADGLRCVNTP